VKDNAAIDEKEKKRRLFPGLSLPDQDWQPSVEKDVFMKEVDDMMAQLEGVQKKKADSHTEAEGPQAKRQRRSRSRSPRRRSPSPRRGRRDDRFERRVGRSQIDERPVLYKIYNGRVSSLKDFGAFISLEGVAGRVEGTPDQY
jgi:ATP-dependent RNA helicase DHX8/PRP22